MLFYAHWPMVYLSISCIYVQLRTTRLALLYNLHWFFHFANDQEFNYFPVNCFAELTLTSHSDLTNIPINFMTNLKCNKIKRKKKLRTFGHSMHFKWFLDHILFTTYHFKQKIPCIFSSLLISREAKKSF